MGLVAKGGGEGGTYTPVPQGMHRAVCSQVIDKGHQWSDFYGKEAHKILIGWELPDELDDEGKVRLIWKQYTLSLHEKSNLYGDLVSWRGRAFTAKELEGFDLTNIIGAPCQLNIVHNERDGKTYANVQTVNPLGKGMAKPEVENRVVFDIDDPDMEAFSTFSENLQNTIKDSREWRAREGRKPKGMVAATVPTAPHEYVPIDESDIPF